ncbi:hypothetical protein D3C76_1599370 [compost metagenome]
MQLIAAMPPAAMPGLSRAGGMVQNSGMADSAAAEPMVMRITAGTRWPCTKPRAKKQEALTRMVAARCQRRSWRLSELRPSRYMPTSARAKGRAEIMPMVRMSSRPKPRIRLGIQYDTVFEPL